VLAVPEQYVGERPVRHEEPAPVHGGERVLERSHVALAPQRPLKARRRGGAEAEEAVDPDRIRDLQPAQQGVGVVVRHVEVGEVHPHLECVDARVPHRGARRGERERGGGGP
jgi:hypothetical protein